MSIFKKVKELLANIFSPNLYGKNLEKVFFLYFKKIPNDKYFFKKVKCVGYVRLPKLDLNKYILDGINFSYVRFNKHTILPKDLNFMQRIKNKDLSFCIMPVGDYSKYNFNGVILFKTKFPEGCILPENRNFFIQLDDSSLMRDIDIPKNMIRNIHCYNLNIKFRVNENLLTNAQKMYIKIKYKDDYDYLLYKKDIFLKKLVNFNCLLYCIVLFLICIELFITILKLAHRTI